MMMSKSYCGMGRPCEMLLWLRAATDIITMSLNPNDPHPPEKNLRPRTKSATPMRASSVLRLDDPRQGAARASLGDNEPSHSPLHVAHTVRRTVDDTRAESRVPHAHRRAEHALCRVANTGSAVLRLRSKNGWVHYRRVFGFSEGG